MNCCTNCFESSYLNAIILADKKLGNCDYCNSQTVYIYEAPKLKPFFLGIIELYEVDQAHGFPIENQIVVDFKDKVFSNSLYQTNNIKFLIKEIIKEDIGDYKEILSKPVRLRFLKKSQEKDATQPLSLSWDKFSKEIKTVNRFHFGTNLDIERLKSLFEYFQKDYKKGDQFYRARISKNQLGYPTHDMGNPPPKLARSGRANPKGISYLYVAKDVKTTLYEARAGLFDFVTVGTFRLKEDIKVVNLNRSTYDVFRLAELESLEDVMLHGSFTDKLEDELSKPRRKSDSELDYLPTQYLSELIKSMGFDGIEYKSSLYSKGYSIAIFNPEKLECEETHVYDIQNIELEYSEV